VKIVRDGRLFGALNLLDIIIILAVAAAGFVAWRYVSGGALGGERGPIHFTVELNDVTDEFIGKIRVGDDIKDSVKGYYLGKVSDVRPEEYVLNNWDSRTEAYVKSVVPGRKTVRVEIAADGVMNERAIYAGEIAVKIGRETSIKGKGYAGTGYIVELRED
jgi:ABC-type transporter Mla subunit MlaD